jgi:hypothetical protein
VSPREEPSPPRAWDGCVRCGYALRIGGWDLQCKDPAI